MIESVALGIGLKFVAEKVFAILLEKAADRLCKELQSDAPMNAFEEALTLAVKRYATSDRAHLLKYLVDPNGFLADDTVTGEIAKLLLFKGDPSAKIISTSWQKACAEELPNLNFDLESRVLVEVIEEELRSSETFRPAFEARDLNSVAVNAERSTEHLHQIREELRGMTELINSGFGDLVRRFDYLTQPLRQKVVDQSTYMESKSRDFVGREWVFKEIHGFFEKSSHGYFFLAGDPGIGKSAIASQFVKTEGCVHHFNIRAQSVNNYDCFAANVCAQLTAAFDLPQEDIIDNIGNPGFLEWLLKQVSSRLKSDERCVIVVDALDEVEKSPSMDNANPLHLPISLPAGIYIVATMRPKEAQLVRPLVDCESRDLTIEHDDGKNMADVRLFLGGSLAKQGIKDYCASHGLRDGDFVELMAERSEGNFMYLRYVLPEVERGVYKTLDLEGLPGGLSRYYEDHWSRMRGLNEDAWFEYKLPVLVVLAAALEPISSEFIFHVTGIKRARIAAVLAEWAPFLHRDIVRVGLERQYRYSLYHASFLEFVNTKEVIQGERVDLTAMRVQIASSMDDSLL